MVRKLGPCSNSPLVNQLKPMKQIIVNYWPHVATAYMFLAPIAITVACIRAAVQLYREEKAFNKEYESGK